ncbi:myb-like protein D, partial [Piliocolobus tephrosceles]|uniref:myb-like protein D n=1 Tax=Piliocolobus tephrosceles TaxID=591936 RepID=UPI000C2B2692
MSRHDNDSSNYGIHNSTNYDNANNMDDLEFSILYNNVQNTCNSRGNLQKEFEDYYKNYLHPVSYNNRNMILKKEFTHHKDYNFNDYATEPDDINKDISSSNENSSNNEINNNIHNMLNLNSPNEKINNNIQNGREGYNDKNPFTHFSQLNSKRDSKNTKTRLHSGNIEVKEKFLTHSYQAMLENEHTNTVDEKN